MLRLSGCASLLLIFVLLALGFVMPVSAGSDCFDDAEAAFEDGDYDDAYDLFSCAIDDDPENYEAFLGRGNSTLLGSLPSFNNDTFPDYRVVYNNDFGLLEDSIDDYSDAIDDDDEAIEPLILRAFTLWYLARDDEALDDYDAIIDLDDENAFAYLFRGSSNQYLGNTRDVEDDFAMAIDLDSDNPDVFELIGETYQNTGEFELAIEAYDELIDINPDDAYIHSRRGYANLALENSEDAIDDFSNAIDIDSDFADAYLGRGDALLAEGEEADAAADYAEYARLIEFELESEELDAGDSIDLDMANGTVYEVEFEAEEGDEITIAAESADGVDTLIVLIDPDGEPLTGSNDVDFFNGETNSEIEGFEAPADGTYIIVVTHGSGFDFGEIEVSLEID